MYPGRSRKHPGCKRMHRTQAGVTCITLLRFLLTSEPRQRPSGAPWCVLHAPPPGWYMLHGPTLRITRGVVAQGVVTRVDCMRWWVVVVTVRGAR